METNLDTWHVVAFMCTWFGGVMFNYVNKVTREGVGKLEYWTRNPLGVLSSFSVSLGICITMLLDGETNHLTYFTVAFMAENLMNVQRKPENKNEKSMEKDTGK